MFLLSLRINARSAVVVAVAAVVKHRDWTLPSGLLGLGVDGFRGLGRRDAVER